MTFRIGIISDTHGLLRPEAERGLTGVDHIIHAGDIGRPEIVDALRRIAPVTAIVETWTAASGPTNIPTRGSCAWRESRFTFCTT
jgi:predicted phosphodiesterase